MSRRALAAIAGAVGLVALGAAAAGPGSDELTAHRVEDFEPQVMPVHEAWARSSSKAMVQTRGAKLYAPRFRIAYSGTGLYLLVECADAKLSTSFVEDGTPLWEGDALGLVLEPRGGDEASDGGAVQVAGSVPRFEYVFSPTGRHAVRVADAGESLADAEVRKAEDAARVQKVFVMGDGVFGVGTPAQAGLEGWVAELYLPYSLLGPALASPPQPGDRWRVGLYRVDYDGEEPALWSWPGSGEHPLGREIGLGVLLFR